MREAFKRASWLVLTMAEVFAMTGSLASCSGSDPGAQGGSSGPPSPSLTSAVMPRPSPQITAGRPPAGAVAVARRWWDLMGQDRFDDAAALVAPGSPLDQTSTPVDAILAAHFVGAQSSVVMRTLSAGETVAFPVRVYVKPKYPVGDWDKPGIYVQYMGFVRMSDGSWRVYQTGTSP